MDAKTLRQFEEDLVNEFFANLQAQQTPAPRQIATPQAEQKRPYYAGPSQRLIEREQIENQLRALVEASTARLYEMLTQRLDEMKAEQARQIEAEQKRWILEVRQAARISPPCTPSRNSRY